MNIKIKEPNYIVYKAIHSGKLHVNSKEDKKYAGNFRYMYSENDKNYFVNIITHEIVSFK